MYWEKTEICLHRDRESGGTVESFLQQQDGRR